MDAPGFTRVDRMKIMAGAATPFARGDHLSIVQKSVSELQRQANVAGSVREIGGTGAGVSAAGEALLARESMIQHQDPSAYTKAKAV